MIISQTCQHGLRAVFYIASYQKSEGRSVPIRQISKDLNISFHYLTKTLRKLTEAKILVSTRGPAGGVRLARPLREIQALEIVQVLNPAEALEGCVLGLENCSSANPCPMHEQWAIMQEKILSMFRSTDLEVLRKKIQADELRLSDHATPSRPADLAPPE